MICRKTLLSARLAEYWRILRDYLGAGWRKKRRPVDDLASLQWFLTARANQIAQASLYGYLRTRAGVRFPELFTDDVFVVSINIAKWQLWLACLSDLCVYAGGLVWQRTRVSPADVGRLMMEALESVLDEAGVPGDAGPQFAESADRVRDRVRSINWAAVEDNETPFCESPAALVRWAPVVDELKQLDEEIVRNSVRFRWQEVRRDLRTDLDAEALLNVGPEAKR